MNPYACTIFSLILERIIRSPFLRAAISELNFFPLLFGSFLVLKEESLSCAPDFWAGLPFLWVGFGFVLVFLVVGVAFIFWKMRRPCSGPLFFYLSF